jgi:hypothetical protein
MIRTFIKENLEKIFLIDLEKVTLDFDISERYFLLESNENKLNIYKNLLDFTKVKIKKTITIDKSFKTKHIHLKIKRVM